MNGERYSVKFLDDATKYSSSYLLKYKTAEEVLATYKKFMSRIKHLYNNNKIFNETSKLFRSDNDGAFMSVFHTYLQEHGIQHQFICDYDHQQGGNIERAHRSINNISRAQMEDVNIPSDSPLWGYSESHAINIKNKSWQKGTNSSKTPHELLTSIKPNISNLHPWGIPAVVNIPTETRSRSSFHGRRCRYLGESMDHRGNIFIDCETNRIIFSRDADFFYDWRTNDSCKHGFDITFIESENNDSCYNPAPRVARKYWTTESSSTPACRSITAAPKFSKRITSNLAEAQPNI
jgi:hypothetical protein